MAHAPGGAVGSAKRHGGVRDIQNSVYCTTGTKRPGGGYVPDMRVSLYPGRSTEAPPGETAGELGRRVATWGYWRDAVALAGAASTDNVPGGGLSGAFSRGFQGKKRCPVIPAGNAKGD